MSKILIVDDDENNRLLITSLLSFHRHTVLEAEDGVRALALATQERPDLAIVDLRMPGMDGTGFIRALRANPELTNVAVLLYTATLLNEAMQDFMSLHGVKGVIPKPSDPEEILREVDRALSAR